MIRSLFGLILTGCLICTPLTSTEAGILPWTFDALFGPPGSLQQWALGYPNGNPYLMNGYGGYGGYGYGGYTTNYGYAPNYGYGMNYGGCCGQSTSFYPNYGYSSYGPVGYGYGNACGCSPCGGYGCSNCANGDCGVNSNYSPSPTAEPDNSQPTTSPSDTRTFQKKPLDDDFVPTNKRLNGTSGSDSEVLPNTNSGDFMKPAPVEPGSGLDLGSPSEVLPNRGGLQPLDNGGGLNNNNGGGGVFPGGGDAESFDALKPTGDIRPLDIESNIASNVNPNRRRILMRTGYRIPSVVRVHAAPKSLDAATDTKIAAK